MFATSQSGGRGRSTRRSRRPRRPWLESLEDRCLLALGFLQGVAYDDANGNDRLDPTDPRLEGAVIRLCRDNTLVAATVTDSDGYYIFLNAAPGNYRLVQTPPEGYVARSAQGNSQINPVTVPANTRDELRVNLLDPDRLSSSFVGMGAFREIPENGVRLFGQVP